MLLKKSSTKEILEERDLRICHFFGFVEFFQCCFLQISLARLLCDQLGHPPDLRHRQVPHRGAAQAVGGDHHFR